MNSTAAVIVTASQDWSDPRNPTLTVDHEGGSFWTFGLRADDRWGTLVTIRQDGATAPGGWSADTIARRRNNPGRFALDAGAGWYMPAPVVAAWAEWLDMLGFGLDD